LILKPAKPSHQGAISSFGDGNNDDDNDAFKPLLNLGGKAV